MGTLALRSECQSAQMSKIKNGALDQYGAKPFEQQQFGKSGAEGVNTVICIFDTWTGDAQFFHLLSITDNCTEQSELSESVTANLHDRVWCQDSFLNLSLSFCTTDCRKVTHGILGWHCFSGPWFTGHNQWLVLFKPVPNNYHGCTYNVVVIPSISKAITPLRIRDNAAFQNLMFPARRFYVFYVCLFVWFYCSCVLVCVCFLLPWAYY